MAGPAEVGDPAPGGETMTYVFQCRSCGHEFEMTATVAEYESRGSPACPQCGRQARRIYTPVVVMSAAGKAGGGSTGGGCGCGGGTCGCRH